MPVQQGESRSAGRRLHILVVEDHTDTGRTLARLLTREGHDVCIAADAETALKVYDNERFDLVISDIGLPDKSGLELMRDMQARRPVSAIALSGFGMEDDIVRSRDAGFQTHLTKPVNVVSLMECIRRISVAEGAVEDFRADPQN